MDPRGKRYLKGLCAVRRVLVAIEANLALFPRSGEKREIDSLTDMVRDLITFIDRTVWEVKP